MASSQLQMTVNYYATAMQKKFSDLRNRRIPFYWLKLFCHMVYHFISKTKKSCVISMFLTDEEVESLSYENTSEISNKLLQGYNKHKYVYPVKYIMALVFVYTSNSKNCF